MSAAIDDTLIEDDRLAELRLVLGEAQIARLVDNFIAELATAPDHIAALCRAGDLPAARAAAHHLKGPALGLGCSYVAALAGALETAPAEASASLAALLEAAAQATAARLHALA